MTALEKEKPASSWVLETWHDRFNSWFELMQKERMMMSLDVYKRQTIWSVNSALTFISYFLR